ncbi:MAG: hypothetical protein GY832_22485 [Chloroflexi bacterium]|nr:hypothetical protein [Chloroflexota bacterium]
MFAWIKSWRERRRLKGRGLFCFHDGQRYRYVDPLRMWREIECHEKFNLKTMPELVEKREEPESSIFYAAMCEVFGVEQFDDSTSRGMTNEEVMALLANLADFLGAVKKNISNGQTSPPDTE